MNWLKPRPTDIVQNIYAGLIWAGLAAIVSFLYGVVKGFSAGTIALWTLAAFGSVVILFLVVKPFWRASSREHASPLPGPVPLAPETEARAESARRDTGAGATLKPPEDEFEQEQQELVCEMFRTGSNARIQVAIGGKTPGTFVSVSGTSYRKDGNPSYHTRYELALRALERRGLVRDIVEPNILRSRHDHPPGVSFTLTDNGKRRALRDCEKQAVVPERPPGRELTPVETRVICALHKYGDNSVQVSEEFSGGIQGLRVLRIGGIELGNELDGTFAEPARALQALEQQGLIEKTVDAEGHENFRLTVVGRTVAQNNCPKPPVRI